MTSKIFGIKIMVFKTWKPCRHHILSNATLQGYENILITHFSGMNKNGDNTVCDWMMCRHKLYHFTVANTCFTAPLICHGKTKFVTVKWYNLCLHIIQSQTCYPLIKTTWVIFLFPTKLHNTLFWSMFINIDFYELDLSFNPFQNGLSIFLLLFALRIL